MVLSKIFHNNIQITGRNSDGNVKCEKVNRWVFPLALVIILLLVFLYIEYKHPYFFLQDDNRDYYLPYFIHNYESLLNGELALYNFHQFLGIPSLAVGQTGALYPISYLTVFLSNFIFGHYFAAIDIQVIIHLMIGSAGIYKFIRFFDINRKAAFFAGLTWSLSSFIIYVSDSWVVVSAVAAYFPWMLLFSFRLYKTPTLKVNLYAVIVRLLLFYAGHIQYFIYSVIFEFITLIVYVISDSLPGENKIKTFKLLKKYTEGYIYVFIFSLPLLLPMWYQTTISVQRSKQLPFEMFISHTFLISEFLRGLIVPGYGNDGFLSYVGTMTLFLFLIGLYEKCIKKNKIIFNQYIFLIPLFITLLWSSSRIFNYIIYLIPILNRFRGPFKLALYSDFYIIVIASISFAYVLSRYNNKNTYKNILFCLIIAAQILNFAVLYNKFPYNFGTHTDKIPLEEDFKYELNEGRIISLGFEIWSSKLADDPSNFRTGPTLGFNYATLWGLNYFAGYEPLISAANSQACLELNFTAIIESNNPIPVDYLRKAAVKWYIVPKDKADEYSKKFITYGIIPKYEDENRVVFYDAQAYAIVFNSNGEKIESEDYRVTANTIEISVDMQQPGTVIFNNLYNPFFQAYIDGEKTRLTENEDIHFSVSVPEGKHHIMIKYEDPYLIMGTYIAIAFLILFASILTMLYLRKSHN